MRRVPYPHGNGAELADLDALVQAEIASLATDRAVAGGKTHPEPERRRDETGSPRGQPRPPTPMHSMRTTTPRPITTGEEADRLFDQPLDFSEPDPDPDADGPTAADLLTQEEKAFLSRAIGFLSGRPSANLILDQIWSQVVAAVPDGCYDLEEADGLGEAAPGPSPPDPPPQAESAAAAPRVSGQAPVRRPPLEAAIPPGPAPTVAPPE